MPDIYAYKKIIDTRIGPAVSQVLGVTVISAEKIKSGEINHVYKITTERKAYVARVFRYKKWPEDGKLEWIEKQLTKLRIPHAKLLYYSRESTYFPNGFMVSEFVEGMSGKEAVLRGLISETELYRQFGTLAKQFHQVRIQKFGAVNLGKGVYDNFTHMQILGVRKILNMLTKHTALPTNPYGQVEALINNTLTKHQALIRPCLLHGDMSETNTIVTPKKAIVLIDWDNARAGFWLADFIELSRRQLFDPTWKNSPKRMTGARNAFLKGYGKTPFTPRELKALEHTLQVIRQIWQMNYYYFDNVDKKKFAEVKRVFYKLLKEN